MPDDVAAAALLAPVPYPPPRTVHEPPPIRCTTCGRPGDHVHLLPHCVWHWGPVRVEFSCPRHDRGGYGFPLVQWFTGEDDWQRPGGTYTMREHLYVKRGGPATVELVDRALEAAAS